MCQSGGMCLMSALIHSLTHPLMHPPTHPPTHPPSHPPQLLFLVFDFILLHAALFLQSTMHTYNTALCHVAHCRQALVLNNVGPQSLTNMLPFQKAKASFVTLEQSILPGFIPPKPLDRVLKGACPVPYDASKFSWQEALCWSFLHCFLTSLEF